MMKKFNSGSHAERLHITDSFFFPSSDKLAVSLNLFPVFAIAEEKKGG